MKIAHRKTHTHSGRGGTAAQFARLSSSFLCIIAVYVLCVCVCLYSVQHCHISAMKLIRSSSAPLSAELCGMPALSPSSLFLSLLSACCAVARRPSPSLLFLFLFLISFLPCKFCMLQVPLALPHFLLPHSLPYLIPFLPSSPLHSALQPLEVVARPRAPSSCRKLPSLTAHVFFHISTRIFFRVFRMCVFPSRAT